MTAVAAPRAYALWWKDLPRWDIKTARATRFRLLHPTFRPLGNFVKEATELVRPWEKPEQEWPVYGVNNVGGVFFSHNQRGDTFNAPYKRIRPDWFFHNPTRANVGSLGRVPDVPDDALTSPEYQVWRICDGLRPEYVSILIQCRFFGDLIECHRVGAVKERLFVENLREIPVPVRTDEEQAAAIAAWNSAQAELAATRARIAELDERIEADFLADLGLSKPARATLPKCFGVRWKDLLRWSVMFNQLSSVTPDISTGKHPVTTLGDVAAVSYGIQKCPANRPGQHARPYLRVANVQRGELDLREMKYINVPDKEMPGLRVESGDLLVCEGNSADLVGRPAIWRDEIPDCVHQNHILKVRCDRAKALPEYVLEYMQTPPARNHFRSRAKFTTNLASINSNDLREMPLPLPPLARQRELADKLAQRRGEIAVLRTAAAEREQQAKADVEAMILGEKAVK